MAQRRLHINDQIRATQIRLVGLDGNQVGVVPIEEGVRMAKEADLDLVEVAPDATPPVCKILDYGKYKYRQKKRLHQGKHSHGSSIKEIRLHPKTSPHDMEYRAKHARAFLAEGYRVQVNVLFKGREMVHTDLGRELITSFAALVEDVAKVEQMPKMEGRKMHLMLAPKA